MPFDDFAPPSNGRVRSAGDLNDTYVAVLKKEEHFLENVISQGCEHVKTYLSESAHFHDFHIIREIIFSEMMLGIKIRIPKRKPAKWKTLKTL